MKCYLVLATAIISFASTASAQYPSLPQSKPVDPEILANMIQLGPTERRQTGLVIALNSDGWAPMYTQAIFAYLDTKPTINDEEYPLIIRGLARDLSPVNREVDPKKVAFFNSVMATKDLKLQRLLVEAIARRWATRPGFSFNLIEHSEVLDFNDPTHLDFYWEYERGNGYEGFAIELETSNVVLKKTLTSEDTQVRKSSLNAVGNIASVIGNKVFPIDLSGVIQKANEAKIRWLLVQPAWEQFIPLVELTAQSLNSSDTEVKAAAVQTMSKISLIYRQTEKPRLTAKDTARREGLRNILKDSIPTMLELLKSEDEETRLMVAQTLENLSGSVPVTNALAQTCVDRSPFVRWVSCRALSRNALGQDKAEQTTSLELLEKLLQDTDLDVRNAAIRAAASFGPEAGPKLGPVLFKIAQSSGNESKPLVIETLGALKTAPDEVMPLAIELLEGNDLALRRATARALIPYGPAAAPARKALRKALTDPDTDLRKAAQEALIAIDQAPKPKL